MSIGSSMLCSVCIDFDIRKLLLAAEAQPPGTINDPDAPGTYERLRPALFQFFKQHPNISSLRSSTGECDLCRSIWRAYAATAQPAELSDEAMGQGLSTRQIWIGTMAWDATVNGLPHVVVTQHGQKGAMRVLTSFEACVWRGT
jgi:hypothetical protein